MICIILADDHPVFRAGLSATLTDEPDMLIVGEATTGDAIVDLCAALMPDVLLLDLRMPGQRPEETVAILHACLPKIRIVVVTAFDDVLRLRALVHQGASGYVLKDEPPAVLVEAVRAVYGGSLWFSPALAGRLQKGNVISLTGRERELLQSLAAGWRTVAIASHLHLGEQTVRNYLSVLYEKIGVSNRTAAVHWAREHGLF